MPCLRRATSLAYNDEERLLSIGGGKGEDEWVETHTGRSHVGEGGEEVGEIDDIPDADDHDGVVNAFGGLSLNGGQGSEPTEIPDIDDIPDMEEEGLEDEDEAAVAAPKAAAPAAGVIDARCVRSLTLRERRADRNEQPSRSREGQSAASADVRRDDHVRQVLPDAAYLAYWLR